MITQGSAQLFAGAYVYASRFWKIPNTLGQRFAHSSKEYALLHLLMSRPREILSRTTIAEHIWDYDAEHFSNVIDVYIRNLRQKLCAAREPDLIQTVRGSGYQLKEPVR